MNRRFRFRLENVLKYREEQEKEAETKFAGAQVSLQKTRTELEILQAQLTEICRRQQSSWPGSVNVYERLLQLQYAEYLTSCISNKAQAVREQQTDVDQKRLELEQKMIAKKVLSRLHDKQKADCLKQDLLLERKQNDEAAVIAFTRKA